MGIMDHQDVDVICDDEQSLETVPDWAPAFRAICRYLEEEGHLEDLDEMEGLGRRADSYRLIDVVMFLVAYLCANPNEGGLRDFWYSVRDDQQKLAAWFGRQSLPSSSSVSRFLDAVDADCAREFGQWALGQGTNLTAMARRPQAQWQDTCADGWQVVDWDPKARLIRQRTLVGDEDDREARRFGPEHGAVGRAGRKRGELKFVRGLMAHAGTSQWLGAYRQEGNGTLVDQVEVVRQARQTLDEQLGEASDRPPILRIDGEGGEACVINAVAEAGWLPLVRLKQYHLLERQDVREVIDRQEPTVAEGTGTGPTREVFEIGQVPLTSNRRVDQVDRWDEPIDIRLIVSRYPKTEADEGPGKLIDGMRYELFGTHLPRKPWPAESVVDLYFGRSTIENYFAGADRELELEKLFSRSNPAGQQLATTVSLWVWNLMVEIGDRLVDEEQIPEPTRRGPTSPEPTDSSSPRQDQTAGGRASGARPAEEGLTEPIESDGPEATLSASTLQRLNGMGMTYRSETGILECAAGYHLAPIKSGKQDDRAVRFRIIGRPCRGCPERSQCTDSTNPNFQKEVTIANQQVPAAVDVRDSQRGVPLGIEPANNRRAGPFRIRRPGLLAAKRRRCFRRAARRAELRVTVKGGDETPLAESARQHIRHRRTRQRLPRPMRRRYRRLSAEATVTCRWVRGSELAQAVTA